MTTTYDELRDLLHVEFALTGKIAATTLIPTAAGWIPARSAVVGRTQFKSHFEVSTANAMYLAWRHAPYDRG